MEPEVTTEAITQSVVEQVMQARAEEAVALPPVMTEIEGPVPQETQAMPEAEYSDPRPDSLPEPDAGEIIMTRAELGRSRKPWIKEVKFRVYTEQDLSNGLRTGWWGQGFNGYHPEKERGGLETYEKVMTLNTSTKYWLYVVDPTFKAEEKPADPRGKRRCNMATFLGSAITGMMKLSPNNETFRAKLMATLGEMPPKDCNTFEKIKDWVEFNFPQTKGEITKESLKLRVTFSENETGRCNYTRSRTAVSHIRVTDEDFERALEQAGDEPDFDEVVSNLTTIIEEKAVESVDEYMDTNLSTSDEEPNETNNEDYDYPYSTMKSNLREYIRLNHPDHAEGMGLL